jgi:hypothetical protein
MIDGALEDTIRSLKAQLEKERIETRRLRFLVGDAKAFVDSVVKREHTEEKAYSIQRHLAKEL